MEIDSLRTWIGKTESRSDQITLTPIAALSATLDRNDPHPKIGDPIPPLWHYLFFLGIHRQSEIGTDGIVTRGGFLPPVPLPRRMFGGSRQEFHRSLHVGDHVSRVSRIVDVSHKEGRAGPLVFVLVRHEISNTHGLAVTEEQDVIYRENSKPGDPVPAPQKAPENPTWTREIRPDEVFLFRYSALTFNGHRIHYDRPYTNEVEGYRQLLVHGSLIAVLLHDLLRRSLPDALVTGFSSRSVRPLFNGVPFSVCGRIENDGKTVKLWAADIEGLLAADAIATLA
jgi:3-methylfumaryl-CoA hydratase